MAEAVRSFFAETENTRLRSALVLLLGSGPLLFLFLTNPEIANPYYVFGLGITAAAVLTGVFLLISSQMGSC